MAKSGTLKLSKDGAIVLPIELRRQLGIEFGSEFLLRVNGGKIELELLPTGKKLLRTIALNEALEVANSLSDEWKSDLDAVAAVREQRR